MVDWLAFAKGGCSVGLMAAGWVGELVNDLADQSVEMWVFVLAMMWVDLRAF